jgi:hypothetical protein
MSTSRLSPLDASFLAVETANAHMHVGWAAVFEPPADRPAPTFADCRDHIAGRMCRAPRFRQLLSPPPLGFGPAIWVDDPAFDVARHVSRSRSRTLTGAIDWFLSKPLRRDRPLWQICVADQLEDGRLAVIGKAHHCMVDGIAAVELASLLVDPEPDPPAPGPDGWIPRPAPGAAARITGALADAGRRQVDLAALPARIAGSPSNALALAERGARAARADRCRPSGHAKLAQPADLGRATSCSAQAVRRGPGPDQARLRSKAERRLPGCLRRRRSRASAGARRAPDQAQGHGAGERARN